MGQHDGATAGVLQDVALHCDDEHGRPMAFIATCRYASDDPYAVWLTFHIPSGDVPWVMARSLLATGLYEPAGDGDVRVWPAVDEDGREVLAMDFRTPAGRLRVEVRRTELIGFLRRTWQIVPAGAEVIDLDELIDSLLT